MESVNMEEDLRKERDYWRDLAAYLASCHAATAEGDGMLASASQSRKRRYAAICKTAGDALGGNFPRRGQSQVEHARDRCYKAMRALGFEG